MQSLAIGLAGQLGIHIAQVFVGGGVAGVGADRHFQRGAGLVKLALAGIQHSQVVIGLRQLRVVFGQSAEGGDGLGGFAGVALDHAFDEAHLRVAGFACQVLVGLGECLIEFTVACQLGNVGVVIRMGGGEDEGGRKCHQTQ